MLDTVKRANLTFCQVRCLLIMTVDRERLHRIRLKGKDFALAEALLMVARMRLSGRQQQRFPFRRMVLDHCQKKAKLVPKERSREILQILRETYPGYTFPCSVNS